jgi:hypothetical protein
VKRQAGWDHVQDETSRPHEVVTLFIVEGDLPKRKVRIPPQCRILSTRGSEQYCSDWSKYLNSDTCSLGGLNYTSSTP